MVCLFCLLHYLLQGLVWELVEGALLRVSMRPSEDQVAREVAEWQARKEAALISMSRQLADRYVWHPSVSQEQVSMEHGDCLARRNVLPAGVCCTKFTVLGHARALPLSMLHISIADST
jgi:hypothetical protein